MRAWLSLTCALSASTALSQGFNDIEYSGSFPIQGTLNPRRGETTGSNHIDDIGVKVFPHTGRYATPQGRETVLNRIQLKSDGACTSVTNGTSRNHAPGAVLDFPLERARVPIDVTCESPVTVVRERGLRSYAYTGRLRVQAIETPGTSPYVEVVNWINYEDYLRGVVAAEMPASWPAEALKAQAVAARTYGIYEILLARQQGDRHQRFDIDDTVQYQAYLGVSGATAATDRAIAETRDIVVTYNGVVIKAYFSADSGGHTEAAENVWGDPLPYCVAKREVYDPALVPSAWDLTYDAARARQLMYVAGKTADRPWRNALVDATERFASGRVRNVRVEYDDGTADAVLGVDVGYVLRLRSSLFDIEFDGANLRFKGRGFGHGVGMSQWGAKVLVESKGWTFRDVLKFYYTNVDVGPARD